MTNQLQDPKPLFGNVIIGSGHMIDAADRKLPRFPASKTEPVRAAIARQLEVWKIGPDDLAICGGANGADILFAEECLRRGTSLRLLLAQTVEDFVRDSVERAGNDWVERFHRLCQKADVATLPESTDRDAKDLSIYERANLWIVATAREEVAEPGRLYAVLVWDEKPTGDGPGGTSDFETRVRDLGGAIAIINPTTLPQTN